MSGTCIFPFCRKSETATENTTEAEMTAANHLGKALRWLHLFTLQTLVCERTENYYKSFTKLNCQNVLILLKIEDELFLTYK
jgi:hypothetical protein